jgi:drug/metabolite transporter (DMT)-like permease
LGVLGYGIYQLLWVGGLSAIPAGDSALLIAATPVITAVLAGVVGADRLTPPVLAGALLSFAGVAIVIGEGVGLDLGAALANPRVLTGDLLTLAAAVVWAVYTVLAAAILRRVSPLRTIAWAVAGGSLLLAPIGIAQIAESGFSVSGDVLLGLVYSGLISVAVSNVFVFRAVRQIGPTRTTAFQFLIPAFAVIFAGLFLAEPIRPGQVVGGAVIVVGLLLARRASGMRWRRLSSAS